MSDTWGPPTNQPTGNERPVAVLIGVNVADPRSAVWQQSVQMDARFRLVAVANNNQDLQTKLAESPEVILLDVRILDGPQVLIETLTKMTAAVYVLLPAGLLESKEEKMRALPETIKAISSVKQVYVGDMNIADFLTRAYGDALALRKTIAAPVAWSGHTGRQAAVTGMRIVATWNLVGGVGRSTITTALAQAVARKSIRSLLVGLDAPDLIPLHLGLKPQPENILKWFANPTEAGMRNGLQTLGDLDVLAGFPDVWSLSDNIAKIASDDSPNSIRSLVVNTAAYSGYAGIFLDAPVAGIAPRALAAANTWIMVARPTLADAWASVDAFRTITQRAAGQHRINPGNIFVVLNMRTQGMLSPNDWHRAADQVARNFGCQMGFPPVAAVIPFIPGIPLAQDAGRPTIDASDEFARPIHVLADMLFGGQAIQPDRGPGKKKGFSIKIKH